MTNLANQSDVNAMRALLLGVVTAATAKAFREAVYLTQPTKIETVDPAIGLVRFRLASGLLVTVQVKVTDA